MGNRAFSVLVIHYTSQFSFHSSFSIILIISTVRWVARAEIKRLGVAGKFACGWQCSDVVGIWKQWRHLTAAFSASSGERFHKKRKREKTKTAWCQHGQRVKCLLTTAEWRTALLFFGLLPSLLAVMWFCFSSLVAEGLHPNVPPGTGYPFVL